MRTTRSRSFGVLTGKCTCYMQLWRCDFGQLITDFYHPLSGFYVLVCFFPLWLWFTTCDKKTYFFQDTFSFSAGNRIVTHFVWWHTSAIGAADPAAYLFITSHKFLIYYIVSCFFCGLFSIHSLTDSVVSLHRYSHKYQMDRGYAHQVSRDVKCAIRLFRVLQHGGDRSVLWLALTGDPEHDSVRQNKMEAVQARCVGCGLMRNLNKKWQQSILHMRCPEWTARGLRVRGLGEWTFLEVYALSIPAGRPLNIHLLSIDI